MNVFVYDLLPDNVEQMEEAGAQRAESAAEAAKGREIVITMLPNSPQVRDVVLGPQGIAEAMTRGSILIDMSSIAPLASREIGETLEEKGIEIAGRAGFRR